MINTNDMPHEWNDTLKVKAIGIARLLDGVELPLAMTTLQSVTYHTLYRYVDNHELRMKVLRSWVNCGEATFLEWSKEDVG
jgi:hypothetical protein